MQAVVSELTGGGHNPAPPRWLRRGLVAAIAGLLLAGSGLLYLRQGPSELTVDDAIARYRAQSEADADPDRSDGAASDDATSESGDPTAGTIAGGATADSSSAAAPPAAPGKAQAAGAGTPAAAPSNRATPAEGVYVYETSGYEETDAFGGSRHDYPDKTTVTMRKGGCGWTERWEPLSERWDESHLCHEPAGTAIRVFKTYHQFFQRSQQQDYDCPAGSHVGRDNQAPGATWTWSCTSSFGKIDTKVIYVGVEQLTIGGAAVSVEHLRYESTLTGSNRGTQLQERWVSRATGHSVRIKTDIDLDTDSPFGTVGYQEHYDITLTSLTPRR